MIQSETWKQKQHIKSSQQLSLGCSSHTRDRWDSGNSYARGFKDSGNPGGGGLNLKKSSAGSFWPIVHVTQTFGSVTLQQFQILKIVEIFCSHIFHLTYNVPVNDNLSSFAGHFIEENRNSKILKNEPLQHCCNKKFETPDTFLLVLQAVYITFSRPGY